MTPKTINISYTAEDGTTHSREYTDLSQVWHDASEMPQGDKWDILCYGRGYMLADEYCFTGPEFVKDHEIQQWAYLDDLLPSDNVPSNVPSK